MFQIFNFDGINRGSWFVSDYSRIKLGIYDPKKRTSYIY